jgi:hypothetical protein
MLGSIGYSAMIYLPLAAVGVLNLKHTEFAQRMQHSRRNKIALNTLSA